jgi:predicted DNA-binding transcriptional regulator AlpA
MAVSTTKEAHTEGFARWPEVKQLTGAGRSTIWRWEQAGRFPKRCRIGPNISAWPRMKLREWKERVERGDTWTEHQEGV